MFSRIAITLLGSSLVGECAVLAGVLPPATAGVETFARYGIEFSRVQAANVTAFGPSGAYFNLEREFGGGSWDFGLARTELTQGQWIEMPNAFNNVAIPIDQPWSSSVVSILSGLGWAGPGIYATMVGLQGRLFNEVTKLGAVLPVAGMGWVGSMMYCNWLHNDRATTVDSLLQGAYDIRGWDDFDPQTWLTITRSADARFWVPTYDEWAVGSFYDPNRFGPGEGGWWPYLNRLTRLPIPGPPGIGETSSEWNTEPSPIDTYLIPVGSYTDSQSPWGLLDTSGSRYEGLEDALEFDRLFAGTLHGPSAFPELERRLEQPGWVGAGFVGRGLPIGLRIATSTVPGPVTALLVVMSFIDIVCWRQRR